MSQEDIQTDYEAYALAVREQTAQHLAGLDELSAIIAKRPLTFNERNAAERGLQVVVESAIGCAKHYLKSRQKPVPSEARAAIERVYELLAITEPDIKEMRGAVGMRNAIIHDYLNLDWRVIEPVLKQQKYTAVQLFVKKVLGKLVSSN